MAVANPTTLGRDMAGIVIAKGDRVHQPRHLLERNARTYNRDL
jgi:hypothetical protein